MAADRGALLWLRNDLRLLDQPLLNAGSPLPALFVYVFDLRFLSNKVSVPGMQGELSLQKAGARRALFLLESVKSLGCQLLELFGSHLAVRRGNPEQVLPALAGALGWDSAWELHCQRELGTEEEQVQKSTQQATEAKGGRFVSDWGKQWLFHPDDVATDWGVDPSRSLVNPHHFWNDSRDPCVRVRPAEPAMEVLLGSGWL